MKAYYPTTAAEIIEDINTNARTNGDIVYLPAGTYDCSATPLAPAAGVTIRRSGTPGYSGCTIQGRIDADLEGSANALTLQDFTLDVTGLTQQTYGTIDLNNGTYYLNRVCLTGTGTGNLLTLSAEANATVVECRNCLIYGAEDDCVSTKSAAGGAVAAASVLRLYDCEVHTPGSDASEQLLTAHDGVPIYDYRGYYHDQGGGNGIDPDGATSKIYLEGTRVYCNVKAFAYVCCYVEAPVVHLLGDEAYMIGCRIVSDATAAQGVYMNGDNQRVESNWVSGATKTNAAGIYLPSLVTATGTFNILNNRVSGCYRGYYFREEQSPTINLYNNLADTCTQYDVFVYGASGTATVNGDYNVLPGTLSGYSANTDDLTVAAELEADGTPTASGNCDASGKADAGWLEIDGLARAWRDRDGTPRLAPGGATVCRGPIERLWEVIKGTVTLSGENVHGATVYAIDTTNGDLEASATSSNGVYSLGVATGQTYHISCQYESGGSYYHGKSAPFVEVS